MKLIKFLFYVSLLIGIENVFAIEPTPDEMQANHRWISAKFEGLTEESELAPGIHVLENLGPVLLDHFYNTPLKIGETSYDQGIFCHATSRLHVILPKPGKKFSAIVGVNHDPDTTAGYGSVCFKVKIDEKTVYQSDILRGTEPGVPIEVDLNGATQFELCVDDGGDNVNADHSDWANANIVLEDGTVLIPGKDLPLFDAEKTFEPTYPFSFIYDGQHSSEFLSDWLKMSNIEKIDDDQVLHTLVFVDPDNQLEVTCTATEYLDFPVVKWFLRFKNLSDSDTKIVQDVKAIDTVFQREAQEIVKPDFWDPNLTFVVRENRQKEFLLHHWNGSTVSKLDYCPYEKEMKENEGTSFAPSGGAPLQGPAPYFNLQANKKGWIVVLGWTGQWHADFQRLDRFGMRVSGGQEQTHFKLLPGEDVRSPSVVVLPWFRENWFDAQNLWRAWMVKHNVPRLDDGTLVTHHIAACSSHFYHEMMNADTQSQKFFIDRYLEEKIPLDYWWMDAGWYPFDGGPAPNDWAKTGTWEVDQRRFPGGFRPITDYGRSKGVKTIVWFEPERVYPGSWLAETHPDWIIGELNVNWGGLLNYSDPEVLDWTINHFDAFLKREGVDLYRQDFSYLPLSAWQSNDAEDRQGVTEAKHIEGYWKYWDALRKRNPDLRIDSCSGGGRRNEFETMCRAVPLLRSDYIIETDGSQNQAYGIAFWLPYYGTAVRAFDDYVFRSSMAPFFNMCYDMRDKESNFDNVRKNVKIWEEVLVPVFGADYYPLTEPALERDDVWIGWQFNDPKAGIGSIQMFRRVASPMEQGCFCLYGLEPAASYEITNVDTQEMVSMTGAELMQDGLTLTIPKPFSAVIYSYKKR